MIPRRAHPPARHFRALNGQGSLFGSEMFLARVSSGQAPAVYPLKDPRVFVFDLEYPTKSQLSAAVGRGSFRPLEPKAWLCPTAQLRSGRPLWVGAAAIAETPTQAVKMAWDVLRIRRASAR